MSDVTDGPGRKGQTGAKPSPAGAVRPEVADVLKQNLRRAYEDIASEEIPSRFLDLLAQLRASFPGTLKD